jgi:hypothetical protein
MRLGREGQGSGRTGRFDSPICLSVPQLWWGRRRERNVATGRASGRSRLIVNVLWENDPR